MTSHELIIDGNAFRTAIATWRHERQLWIDTEVADWATKAPRLSLLQVRTGSGWTCVVDVLDAPNMRQVLDEEFIPQVMENEAVEKWAHYARFERRFLGEDRVRNLNCTFELARSIPYYQLPLRSLSLAALVERFCGVTLDKTFQQADWGKRPLSEDLRAYAASDTEWCYRVHGELLKLPRPPIDPTNDDPNEIRARYLELLIPLKSAQAKRSSIRDAVKEYMTKESVRRLSRFALDARTTYSTDFATLVEFALVRDPGGYFDLTISLNSDLRSQFDPDVLTNIRSVAKTRFSQSFRSPRAPRSRGVEPPSYDLDPEDPERLTNDYEHADHEVMIRESERGELRDRMRRWMRAESLEVWEDFGFSRPREAWKVDLRALKDRLPIKMQTGFPQRLRLAFQEADLKELIAIGRTRETPVLRWLPRAFSVGPEAQQSRDWSTADDPTEHGDDP